MLWFTVLQMRNSTKNFSTENTCRKHAQPEESYIMLTPCVVSKRNGLTKEDKGKAMMNINNSRYFIV